MRYDEYGAVRRFLNSRSLDSASPSLKSLKMRYFGADRFAEEAQICGFKHHQIYFVQRILKHKGIVKPDPLLKWFLLHLMYQHDTGHLRSSLLTIKEDIEEWIPEENSPVEGEKLAEAVPGLLERYAALFRENSAPFVIQGDFIYISRMQIYERSFLELLDERLSFPDRVFKEDITTVLDWGEYPLEGKRKEAVEKAIKKNFLIVSGGPGTGKTTTVVSILRGLKYAGLERILLAAPTGRAANRMIESITSELKGDTGDLPVESVTLHKLLGIVPNKDRPRYHQERRLPADAVIIDEASMVDIHMMYRLFAALKPSAKLILVGDKDQLPSVEAGALLGDMLYSWENPSQKMHDSIIVLDKSWRSVKGILDTARLVIQGKESETLALLKKGVDEVEYKNLPDIDILKEALADFYLGASVGTGFSLPVQRWHETVKQIEKTFEKFRNFTVLCPSRKGLYGTVNVNRQISREFNPRYAPFYHGQPIMITRNDYTLKLFNGDRGIVFAFNNGLFAFFPAEEGYVYFSVSRISDYETSYAGTVHKSQGSEWEKVAVLLPEGSERLLTREILYTALTRAKKKVILYGGDEEVRTSVRRQVIRNSGVREFMLPEKPGNLQRELFF